MSVASGISDAWLVGHRVAAVALVSKQTSLPIPAIREICREFLISRPFLARAIRKRSLVPECFSRISLSYPIRESLYRGTGIGLGQASEPVPAWLENAV